MTVGDGLANLLFETHDMLKDVADVRVQGMLVDLAGFHIGGLKLDRVGLISFTGSNFPADKEAHGECCNRFLPVKVLQIVETESLTLTK